jgi:hypothetical protein
LMRLVETAVWLFLTKPPLLMLCLRGAAVTTRREAGCARSHILLCNPG